MLTYTIMSSRIVYFPSFFPFFCIIHHHASSYIHLFHFFLNLGHILFMRKCHRRRGGEINLMYRAGRVHFSCCQLALSRRYCMVFFFFRGRDSSMSNPREISDNKKKSFPLFSFLPSFLSLIVVVVVWKCGRRSKRESSIASLGSRPLRSTHERAQCACPNDLGQAAMIFLARWTSQTWEPRRHW